MADFTLDQKLQISNSFTRVQIVQESGIKKYMNNGGNFITGVDISSEESAEKRDKRHQRFGHAPLQSATELEFSLDKLEERAKRFGGSARLHNGEIIKTFTKLPLIPEGDIRPEAVYIHGTNDMSTKDVLNYFALYGPSYIEWIDDSSCNAVWEDLSSAHRALYGKGQFPAMAEKELDTINIEEDGIRPIWRLGDGHPKSKQLLLRHATNGDVKRSGAARRSVYYKKYGNPSMGGRRMKQKRNVKSTWKEPVMELEGLSDEGGVQTETGGMDLRSKLMSLRKMETNDEEEKYIENYDDDEVMEIGNESQEIGNESQEIGNEPQKIGIESQEIGQEIGNGSQDIWNEPQEIITESLEIGNEFAEENESEETESVFEVPGMKSLVYSIRNVPQKPAIESRIRVIRNEPQKVAMKSQIHVIRNEPQEPVIKSQVHVPGPRNEPQEPGIKSQVHILRNEAQEPGIKSQVHVFRNEPQESGIKSRVFKNEPQEPGTKSQIRVIRNDCPLFENEDSIECENESSEISRIVSDYVGKLRSDQMESNYTKADLRRKLLTSRRPDIKSRIG